jgi:hypothetical protein
LVKPLGPKQHVFKMPNFHSMRVVTPALAKHFLANLQSHLRPNGSFCKSSQGQLPPILGAFFWLI